MKGSSAPRSKVRWVGRTAGLIAVGATVTTVVATTGILDQGGPAPAPVAGPTALDAPRTALPPAQAPGDTLASALVPTPLAVPGVVVATSALAAATQFPGTLDEAPLEAVLAYQRAASIINSAATCQLDWTILAALGRVQSNHGVVDGSHRVTAQGKVKPAYVGDPLNGRKGRAEVRDTDGGELDGNPRWDAAVGPMGLLPSTWSTVAVDADGDGQRNIQDLDDAALGMAVLLCSGGRDLSRDKALAKELAAFDDSPDFADTIIGLAATYAEQQAVVTLAAPPVTTIPEVMPEVCDCSQIATATARLTTRGSSVVPPKHGTTQPATPSGPAAPATPTTPVTPNPPAEEPTDPVEPTDPPVDPTEPNPTPQEPALTVEDIVAMTDDEIAALTEEQVAELGPAAREAYLARIERIEGVVAAPQ